MLDFTISGHSFPPPGPRHGVKEPTFRPVTRPITSMKFVQSWMGLQLKRDATQPRCVTGAKVTAPIAWR